MRVVVFGGSFDPVHRGHRAMADAVQREESPDLLLWVPSGHAPHKPELAPAAAVDRLALLELVVADRPGERIDRCELERPPPSYSVDTLEDCRRRFADAELLFLAGADSLSHLATWRDLPRLLRLCAWRFAPRPGWGREALDRFRAALPAAEREVFRARMLAMEPVDVSSSAIRARLAAGEEAPGLPAAVAAEIRRRGCYSSS